MHCPTDGLPLRTTLKETALTYYTFVTTVVADCESAATEEFLNLSSSGYLLLFSELT